MFGRKQRKMLENLAESMEKSHSFLEHEIKAMKFQIVTISVQLNEIRSMLGNPGIDMKVEPVQTAKPPKKK